MDADCEREPRHLALGDAICNLKDAVGMVEKFLYELTPPKPGDVETKTAEQEPGRSFSEIYRRASNEINVQTDRLKNVLSDLKGVVL